MSVQITLLVLSWFITVSRPDPIIIRTGVNKEFGKKQDSNIFDLANIKGISNFEAEDGFNRNNEHKLIQAHDTGKYNEEDGNKSLHQNENNYEDAKYHQNGGNQYADFGKKSNRKKGHHKSGFTKSYHKDESSSNSSYYDDEDDEGDEHVRDTKKNSYGDSAGANRRGSEYDDRRYLQDQAKNGYYNKAGDFERGHSDNRDYQQKKYYDNKANQGQRNQANHYGEVDRYQGQKYVQKPYYPSTPHYYDEDPYYNHRPTSAQKKTITIYEDPRYINDGGYSKYPTYEHDYVQLDYRKPTRDYYDYDRYYDHRSPSYDYYY